MYLVKGKHLSKQWGRRESHMPEWAAAQQWVKKIQRAGLGFSSLEGKKSKNSLQSVHVGDTDRGKDGRAQWQQHLQEEYLWRAAAPAGSAQTPGQGNTHTGVSTAQSLEENWGARTDWDQLRDRVSISPHPSPGQKHCKERSWRQANPLSAARAANEERLQEQGWPGPGKQLWMQEGGMAELGREHLWADGTHSPWAGKYPHNWIPLLPGWQDGISQESGDCVWCRSHRNAGG